MASYFIMFLSFSLSLQEILPEVFESLGSLLRTGTLGRFTGGQLIERVSVLLGVWADWSLFPPTFLLGLQVRKRIRE